MKITRELAVQIAGGEEELQKLQTAAERGHHPELARLTGGLAKLIYQGNEYILSGGEEHILELLEAGKRGLLCGRKIM